MTFAIFLFVEVQLKTHKKTANDIFLEIYSLLKEIIDFNYKNRK